jgi:catechol 2,3-dioxygenase-like lactoylglutathione lyase family enzyme
VFIDHFSLGVADLARSARFYDAVLATIDAGRLFECRRKIEMTLGAQSRDDTPGGGGPGERGTASSQTRARGRAASLQ